MPAHADVYAVLASVVENEVIQRDPDVRWYDLALVDSLRTIEIIVELESRYAIEISPTEVDRASWATPRQVAQFVLDRITLAS